VGLTAQRRAGQEDHDRGQEQVLAAVLVAELAPQRRRCGAGQQVGGHDPGQVAQAAEVADDGRQRRRHDGLVQRRQQDGQHQGRVDNGQAAPGLDDLVGRRTVLRHAEIVPRRPARNVAARLR
jgi:hypothetical protein